MVQDQVSGVVVPDQRDLGDFEEASEALAERMAQWRAQDAARHAVSRFLQTGSLPVAPGDDSSD